MEGENPVAPSSTHRAQGDGCVASLRMTGRCGQKERGVTSRTFPAGNVQRFAPGSSGGHQFPPDAPLRSPRGRGLFLPYLSRQKERGVAPSFLFACLVGLGLGGLHLAELAAIVSHAGLAQPVGQTVSAALGALVETGSLQLPHGAAALVPALLGYFRLRDCQL